MKILSVFSSYSVDDVQKAKQFYSKVVGANINEDPNMKDLLNIDMGNGVKVLIYPKPDYSPATYTVLNFAVDDIDAAVDDLIAKGVKFEMYDGMHQDEKGIARPTDPSQGPNIAWFKDPAGNILSVLQKS